MPAKVPEYRENGQWWLDYRRAPDILESEESVTREIPLPSRRALSKHTGNGPLWWESAKIYKWQEISEKTSLIKIRPQDHTQRRGRRTGAGSQHRKCFWS